MLTNTYNCPVSQQFKGMMEISYLLFKPIFIINPIEKFLCLIPNALPAINVFKNLQNLKLLKSISTAVL